MNKKLEDALKRIEALEKELLIIKENPFFKIYPSFPDLIVDQRPCNEKGWDFNSSCMHDRCPECHGTGVRSTGGSCVHMISCPCPKCSPRC